MNGSELGASAFAWVVVLGLSSGAISFFVFRRFTNGPRLRQTINRIVAHLLEIRLFAEEPVLTLRAQRDLIVENGRLLRQVVLPSFLLLVPFGVLLAGMEHFFGHAPLQVGETALVTQADNTKLEVPTGFEATGPPIHVMAERSLVWEVRATREARGSLRRSKRRATVFHLNWIWWFAGASLLGALFAGLWTGKKFGMIAGP